MGSPDAITKILSDMRSAIDRHKIVLAPRKKNMDTLARLGLTWQDAQDEIYSLTEADYHQGPMLDRNDTTSDHLWVFKKRIDGEVIYIKFKVVYQENGEVRVVSFHIAEY